MKAQWKPFKDLQKIEYSVSGVYKKNNKDEPYLIPVKVRQAGHGGLEYTTDENADMPGVFRARSSEYKIKRKLLKTSAGKIKMLDEGEFGGGLWIGGKYKVGGNFRHLFTFKGRKFAVDSLCHMMCDRFKLYEIFDNGEIELVCSTNSDFYTEVGLDLYIVSEDRVIFLCSGCVYEDKRSSRTCTLVNYLLIYDGENIVKKEIPRSLKYNRPNSLVLTEDKLYIGCDKQILKYDFNDNKEKYYTPLSDEQLDSLNI